MIYSLIFSDKSKSALAKLRRTKSISDKIDVLLIEMMEHPRTGTGKPELLKHDYAGLWSRRITQGIRIIYDIKDKTVSVHILEIGHYGDKLR
jgi:toxin YoeB